MTFLNPLALFGLLAAAIPILLHLFNLRKLRTIEFSTLSFLKELQKTRIRRLKLRQILLLILRTLVVVMIVLAFGRPTLRGSLAGSVDRQAKTTALFIIDDSNSMTTSDGQGELLKQARQSAKEAVSLFQDGDEVFLLRLSSLARDISANESGIRDFGLLKKNIDEIKPSAIRQPLEKALRMGARLLTSSVNFNKEAYLFSDFQQGVVTTDDELPNTPEKLFPPETRFYLVPFGDRTLHNFGIESVDVPSAILERGKPFSVQARIGNYSGNDAQDHVVSVFLNGTRVAERSADLPRNSTVPVVFSVPADAVGYIEGFVELEDDDVDYDNRRYFGIFIPDRINALLVGTNETTRYPRLALSTLPSAIGSALIFEEVRPERLSSVEIRRANVVILTTSQGFSSAQISELSSFVKSGGGLILFPAQRLEPGTFNEQMASGLGAAAVTGVDSSVSVDGKPRSFVEFEKAELRHPLFEGIFESGDNHSTPATLPTRPTPPRQLESPRIRISARFAPSAQSTPVITMTNGAPFLIERQAGAGRLLIYAVSPTNEWSDFPSRGLFVPLLLRSVRYLAHQALYAQEVVSGSEVILRSSAGLTGPWTIHTPLRHDIAVTPSQQLFPQLFRFSETDEPGIYTLFAKDAPVQKFVVNLDFRESLIARASSEDLERSLQRVGIQSSAVHEAAKADELKSAVLESRFGTELWKHCLVVALLLAVIELLVARTSKKETILPKDHD